MWCNFGRRNHSSEGISGFGFELTLRLKREEGETAPPTWPAALMQALARYVFQSENNLCAGKSALFVLDHEFIGWVANDIGMIKVQWYFYFCLWIGDHVSWHQPLDGSESRIQHMLMVEDAQMHPIHTAFGTVSFVQVIKSFVKKIRFMMWREMWTFLFEQRFVNDFACFLSGQRSECTKNRFCTGSFNNSEWNWKIPLDRQDATITLVGWLQVVGVCSEELKAAQHWNGPSVIELLKQQPVYVNANSLLLCKFRTSLYLSRIVAIYTGMKDRALLVLIFLVSLSVLVVPGWSPTWDEVKQYLK